MIGRRSSRTSGRHRVGLTPTTVPRRLWDGPARERAQFMDRSTVDWTVLYSLGRRRFYALATWPAPVPVVVEDDTAEGLRARMSEAERARDLRRPPFAPRHPGHWRAA